ncbi:MAG TPA: hypothetical protein PLK94_07565 [Alphaproteobacteria bacterium]|nr:hypothetical protein [Alphaproteobacteria bacterium]
MPINNTKNDLKIPPWVCLRLFNVFFEKIGFDENVSQGAAAYYTTLIEEFFPSFKKIKDIARPRTKQSFGKAIPEGTFQSGRGELLKRGFIAKIIDVDGSIIEKTNEANTDSQEGNTEPQADNTESQGGNADSQNTDSENKRNDEKKPIFQRGEFHVKREMYLPTSPLIIWEKNKNDIKDLGPEYTLEDMDAAAEMLESIYKKNYFSLLWCENGKQEVKDDGKQKFYSLILYYSSEWNLYTLLNSIKNKNNKELRLMLSGLDSFFMAPYIDSYKKMINQGSVVKALFQDDEEKYEKASELINYAKDPDVKGSFEILVTPVHHVTSRRIIYDNMAIDARKIRFYDSTSEPSYIGTVYLMKNDITYLRDNFDSAWKSGKNPSEKLKQKGSIGITDEVGVCNVD